MAVYRRSRPQKTLVLVGCEGASEAGYVRWLKQLARREGLGIAISDENLGGGDVLVIVERFLERMALRRKNRPYRHFGILLDFDTLHDSLDRIGTAERLAAGAKVALLWQSPCHEAFLLRHFEGFQGHRPVDKAMAERQLRGVWPEDFAKGMASTRLRSRVDAGACPARSCRRAGLRRLLDRNRLAPLGPATLPLRTGGLSPY